MHPIRAGALLLPAFVVTACARGPAPATAAGPRSAAPVLSDDVDAIVIPDDPSAPLPVDPKVRTGVLRNGVRWYVEPNARPAGRAELRLAVKAGSVLEDDDQLGIAHFVEHMAFNGTENFRGNELVSYLESIGTQFGAHLNAYTSFDETVYQLQLPTDDPQVLETGFLVLRDWADGVLFDPVECEKERGVVLEEWRLGQGLDQRIQDATLPTLFYGSRYLERLPIGTEASLTNLDCEQARRFYEKWYRPELMGVMAVGDFDPDRVEKLVKKWFGTLPPSPEGAERPWYQVPDHDEMLVTVFTDPELPQGAIIVGDKVPEIEGDDHQAYRDFLLEQMVFLMLNERLAITAQDPEAPYVFAQSGETPLGHLRALHSLTIAPKEGRELEALRAAITELERVKRHGFTRGELDRARDEMARNMRAYYEEREKTDSRTHIEELLRVFLTDEPMPGIPYEYALSRKYLPSMTVEEANRFARSAWFPGRSRVVNLLLPQKDGLPAPTEAEVRAVFAEVVAAELAPPEEEEDDRPLMSELPAPGRAEKVAVDPKLGTTEYRLSNGIRVIVKPTSFQEDEVLFEAFSPGGTSLVSDEEYIPAITATSILLRSGLGEHDAVGLAKKLAGKNARVTPVIGRTREFLRGGASVRDLETMFQLLWLAVREPRFEPRAFELERQGRAEMLRNRQASPDAVFEDTFAELVWAGNPRQTNWSLDDLAHLDLEASERIYRERFADMGDWTFVFVGNIDEATFVPLLERYLASLPSSGRHETWRDDGARRITGVHRLELPRGQTPRGRVRILFHGPYERDLRSAMLLEAVAAILETRLREELRENLGGTYGVSVDDQTTLEPEPAYALSIDFETDPERLDELLAETWNVIDEVRHTTWGPHAIQAIREKNRRQWEASQSSNAWWLASIAGALARGDDPREQILGFPARNASIDAESIGETAARVLNPEQYIQAVQRPSTSASTGGGAGGAGAR